MENTDAGTDTAKKAKITKKRSKKNLETNTAKSTKTTTKAKTKTTSSNTTAKKAKTSLQANALTDDRRRQMIATAAYYRAERRGFNGGNPEEDWLMAESEVDSQLSTQH